MIRFFRGFRYAGEGLWHAFRMERNMQFHAASAVIACVLGVYGRLDREEWLWTALSIALVWSAECINTAIERTVDLTAGSERRPLAKAAKDLAAGAVLIVSAFALLVAALVLLPAVWERLSFGNF